MDPYQPPPNTSLFQLNLDATNGYTLRSAASWAKVFAVVGIIFAILFIALGILTQIKASDFSAYGQRSGSTDATMTMVVFLISGLFYFLSSIFALNFANRVSRALRTNDQNSLNGGFAGLRNYFALWAILLIIAMLFMLFAIASGISGLGNQ